MDKNFLIETIFSLKIIYKIIKKILLVINNFLNISNSIKKKLANKINTNKVC